MKRTILMMALIILGMNAMAQKYLTQNGVISFYSEAPLENIESTNNQVSSVINLENGQMAFTLLMKAFVFDKALMQTHFNEKYVESELYPKAVFKGQIENYADLKLSKAPSKVKVRGELTIHGVTNAMTTEGELHFNEEGKLVATSEFEIALEDYKIKVPASVKDNISSSIRLNIKMQYEKLD